MREKVAFSKLDTAVVLHILHAMRRLAFFFALLFMLLSACNLSERSNALETAATDTPPAVTPAATPAPTTPEPVVPAPVITDTGTTLTIWMPPEMALRTEAGGAALDNQLLAFAAAHPDVEVRLHYKAASGQGSILNYLRTGRNVTPAILPDLIAIPTEQLAAADAEELIHPLDGLISAAMLEDLYPAALALARPGEELIGYPFALTNLTHLAYDSSVITTTLPLNWDQLITTPDHHFVFPAAGRDGAILALEFYQAAGGVLIDESGQVTLQFEPFRTALEQLSHGRNNGFILLQSSNMTTLDESWQAFEAGSAALVQTTSNQFLRERAANLMAAVAPVPGLDGPLPPLVNGWVWAVSATDPAKRVLAIELLRELADSDNMGEWSYQSNILPSRQEALATWPAADPYTSFIGQELARAQPNPISSQHNLIVVVGDAVFDVISLAKSPHVAAEEAVAAMARP